MEPTKDPLFVAFHTLCWLAALALSVPLVMFFILGLMERHPPCRMCFLLGALFWDWGFTCLFSFTWVVLVCLNWSCHTFSAPTHQSSRKILTWWWHSRYKHFAAKEINAVTAPAIIASPEMTVSSHFMVQEAYFLTHHSGSTRRFVPIVTSMQKLWSFVRHNLSNDIQALSYPLYTLVSTRVFCIAVAGCISVAFGALPILALKNHPRLLLFDDLKDGESLFLPWIAKMYCLQRIISVIALPHMIHTYAQLNTIFCLDAIDWTDEQFCRLKQNYDGRVNELHVSAWAQCCLLVVNERSNSGSLIKDSLHPLHTVIGSFGNFSFREPKEFVHILPRSFLTSKERVVAEEETPFVLEHGASYGSVQ